MNRFINPLTIYCQITGRAATDIVLFTGNGTTAAINKLVYALGLHQPLPAVRNPHIATLRIDHWCMTGLR